MRKPRLVISDLPHHVTLRGNNRRQLFSSSNDRCSFVFFLARAIEVDTVELHAMTLMSNHVHLLITPRTANVLPRFVKRLSQRYAQARNKALKQSGRLFEERYFCKPVRSEEQLAATTAYVELNPLRAGLLRAPRPHVWSTFALHVGEGRSCMPTSLWTPSPWYLSLGDDREARARVYRDFVRDVHERDIRPEGLDAEEQREAARAVTRSRRVRRPDRSSAR